MVVLFSQPLRASSALKLACGFASDFLRVSRVDNFFIDAGGALDDDGCDGRHAGVSLLDLCAKEEKKRPTGG